MTGVFLKYLWEKCSKSEPNVIVKGYAHTVAVVKVEDCILIDWSIGQFITTENFTFSVLTELGQN